MNRLEDYQNVFGGIVPWEGHVPKGYVVDFLGALTETEVRRRWFNDPSASEDRYVKTELPRLGNGENCEFWFEAADWVLAAREARGSFVMMTLGAHYGYQAIGSYLALQHLNPMPCKLVAVDAGPENCEWTARHFRHNGIDPERHWILQMAISNNNDPVFFPVGSADSGGNSLALANEEWARRDYLRELLAKGRSEQALKNLILHNTTGIMRNVIRGMETPAEIKLASAVTMKDLLAPYDKVDFIEADIQGAEMLAFPPNMDLLARKVRRMHIGTHGKDVHWALHDSFATNGWEVVFSYPGESKHPAIRGEFLTNDGVLTVKNPRI